METTKKYSAKYAIPLLYHYKKTTPLLCLLVIFYSVGCRKKPESSVAHDVTVPVHSEDGINTDPGINIEDESQIAERTTTDAPQIKTPQGSPSVIDLPKSPPGFSWKYCEEINGAFLLPKDWYWKSAPASGAVACFITKESIDRDGRFTTGVSIFVLKNIPAKTKMSPSQYAEEYIKIATQENELLRQWQNNMGPFIGYGCLSRVYDAEKDAEPIIEHSLMIANDKTGTAYLVIFESPESSWENEWKKGEVILSKLYIDDTI